jgi:hypothetical protein
MGIDSKELMFRTFNVFGNTKVVIVYEINCIAFSQHMEIISFMVEQVIFLIGLLV